MKTLNTLLATFIVLFSMTSRPVLGQERAVIPGDDDVLYSWGVSTEGQLPRKMRFLVWNLHKGSEDAFTPDYISMGIGADVIMNQEIFLNEKMLDTFSYMPHFFFTTATSFFSPRKKYRTGVANISQVSPSSVSFMRTEILEPVIKSPKVVLITSYPIKGSHKKLTVVNIHGINFVSKKSYEHEMERLYETIKDIPSPLVFAGDFNTWNEERMAVLKSYSEKLGLSEARFFPDQRMTFKGFPLDHFLHTADLKILRARVDGFHKGSDHKPLQLEVEYRPLNPERRHQDPLSE